MPKFIVKHFESDNHKVYCLDISTGRICSTGASKIGTEEGYFSDEQEAYLSSTIEKPFSDSVIKVLASISDNSTSKEQYDELTVRLRDYVLASFSRGKIINHRISRKCLIADLMSEQYNHDVTSKGFIELSRNDLFLDYVPAVIRNMTGTKFVAPRNCFYFYPCSDLESFVVPVRPDWAFAFVPPECAVNFSSGNCLTVFEVESVPEIEKMNNLALYWECAYNMCFVASSDIQELNRLQEYLKIKREELLKVHESMLND